MSHRKEKHLSSEEDLFSTRGKNSHFYGKRRKREKKTFPFQPETFFSTNMKNELFRRF